MPDRSYEGDGIDVYWDSNRCIHTGICLRSLPAVFDLERRPWIDIAAADAEVIADAIERCPTGALRYRLADGTTGVSEGPPTVRVIRGGPFVVRGEIRVEDPDGEIATTETRFTLCRCGASENRPFCDGSHQRVGFEATPRIEVRTRRASAESPSDCGPEQRSV